MIHIFFSLFCKKKNLKCFYFWWEKRNMELFFPVHSSPAHFSEEGLSQPFTTVLWTEDCSWATGYSSFSASEHMNTWIRFSCCSEGRMFLCVWKDRLEWTHRVTCLVSHKLHNLSIKSVLTLTLNTNCKKKTHLLCDKYNALPVVSSQ